MEIRRINIEEIDNFNDRLIATIGAFDGVHIGHDKLFKTINELKKDRENFKSAVFTFSYHPDYYLNKRENNGNIETEEDRLFLFEKYDFDYFFILDSSVFKLHYNEFHDKILDRFNVEIIVIGSDFKYGKDKIGSVQTLKEKYIVYSDLVVNDDGEKISSTMVRDLLEKGEVEKIYNVLGHYYRVNGIISKGAGLGRKLGFPTANIDVPENSYLMLEGVYKTNIYIEENKYIGVTNVGKNPTVNTQAKPRIETFILDFDEEIYGKKITVEFLSFIRGEKKFNSIDDLVEEIKRNIEKVRNS